MSTLRPRTNCWISSKIETYDGYGRPQHTMTRRKTKCAIVSLHKNAERTTVRADSSASRGRANEQVFDSRLLLKPNESVQLGDVIEVEIKGAENLQIEVIRIFHRTDIEGRIHHIDIEGETWASD